MHAPRMKGHRQWTNQSFVLTPLYLSHKQPTKPQFLLTHFI